MQKWEYAICKYDVSGNALRDISNEKLKDASGRDIGEKERGAYFMYLGSQGWELVSATPVVGGSLRKLFGIPSYTTAVEYVFKRPIP